MKIRTYKLYYLTYLRALRRGHLLFAARMHELAHTAARRELESKQSLSQAA